MEALIALIALTAMEIVLGIDNIVFIAILVDRLPEKQRALARRLGLGAAMVMRILLLLTLSWILGLKASVFELTTFVPGSWAAVLEQQTWFNEHINGVSWRDIILLTGGLFLIGKSVHEIHAKFEGHGDSDEARNHAGFGAVLMQIAVLDIVFSLDSVITAVGMAKDIPVMQVFKGAFYYIPAYLISIALLILFPEFTVMFLASLVR